MGVLRAGRIRFVPELPPGYQDALAGLPMGYLEKIALGFSRNVFGLPRNSSLFKLQDRTDAPFFVAPYLGANVALCFAGATLGRDLAAQGRPAMIDYALGELADMLGNGIRGAFRKGFATQWALDPYTLGSYSYALPGGASGRDHLGEPLANRLFFAGEAASPGSFSTVRGAYEAGVAAAEGAIEILGRR